MAESKLYVVGDRPLKDDDGRLSGEVGDGGGGGNMDGRVSKLETHMEYVRRDLDKIQVSLAVLPSLATKADIQGWKLQWTAILVAAFAIIVGSIVGGLGWLETRAARVQAAPIPTVIMVPPSSGTSGAIPPAHH